MTVTLRQGNMFHKAGSKLVVLDLLLISQLCLLFAGSYVIVNWRCTVWCNYPSYAHLLLCLTWQFHSKYLTLCVHTTHHNHSMQILLGSASNVTPNTTNPLLALTIHRILYYSSSLSWANCSVYLKNSCIAAGCYTVNFIFASDWNTLHMKVCPVYKSCPHSAHTHSLFRC